MVMVGNGLLYYCKRLQSVLSSSSSALGKSNGGERETATHFLFLDFTQASIIRSFSSSSSTSSIRPNSKKNQQKDCSFTISYLINSCGLSPEAAKSASKKVHFDSPERPDSFLNLLKKYGFNTTQMSKIVKSRPKFLLSNHQKSIEPKLKFLCSIGLTDLKLGRVISSNPFILARGLTSFIIPHYKFLKSVLFRDDMVLEALRPRVFHVDVQNNIAPNLALLREIGVPQSSIQRLLVRHPTIVACRADTFIQKVKKAIKMGFIPNGKMFIYALLVVIGRNESTLQSKIKVFQRWGWSENDILSAFRKHPLCLALSEKNIMATMDFLVQTMGIQSIVIPKNPQCLFYSLEKRIIPRGSVIKVLWQHGVLKKDISFYSALTVSEKCFVDKFVVAYQDQLPQLPDIFQGKVSLQELGF